MKAKPACVSIGILLIAASVAAHAAQFGDFTYESSGTEITITGYTGPGGDVTIPDTIAGLPVTRIGEYAFSGCTGLTSLVIGNSVTNIEMYSFSGCTSLTGVTIPDSVTGIGWGAFLDCSGLTRIQVNEFNPVYSSLEGILFNKNQTMLVQYPAGRAGSYAIPGSVTVIGSTAFWGCTALSDVTIPDSVNSIRAGAFSYCASLTNITIPNSVTSIDTGAFLGCSGLANVTMSHGVTSIAVEAFSGCTGLTSVTIPDSVTSIGYVAFSGCTGLTSVTIPNSVTGIGYGAFSGCTGLTSLTIPDSVTRVAEYAFSGCSGLTGVVIGNSVTTIGGAAFYGCTSLADVTIGNSVTTIGGVAFYGCSNLTSILIPDSVKTIEPCVSRHPDGSFYWLGAFESCTRLTNVTVGSGVTSIGAQTFADCNRLTGVYFEGEPPEVGEGSMGLCPALIVFYHPGTAGWGPTFAGHPTALWIDPPVYSDWLPSSGLLTQYPNACAEADDPDQDGMSNYSEMLAGTDPTGRTSLLILERVPRPADLTEADRTPIAAGQHALYFRSVPGKQYGVQWAESCAGPWNTTAVVIPTTTQKRVVFDKPATHAFYRVILAH